MSSFPLYHEGNYEWNLGSNIKSLFKKFLIYRNVLILTLGQCDSCLLLFYSYCVWAGQAGRMNQISCFITFDQSARPSASIQPMQLMPSGIPQNAIMV